MLRFVDTPSQQVHIICVFFVFIANVSVSISFERLHFRFYNISVFKITIISVSVSVNVGSIISVSVIVTVTEISLLASHPTTQWPGPGPPGGNRGVAPASVKLIEKSRSLQAIFSNCTFPACIVSTFK